MSGSIIEVDTTDERRGLFTESGGAARLLGSTCDSCGNCTFPVTSACSRCGSDSMSQAPLPTLGTVWTWTVQRHQPKPPFRAAPGGFEPFALGYVDLGVVKVEAPLTGRPGAEWSIGDAVELVVDEIDGRRRFSFRPTTAGGALADHEEG